MITMFNAIALPNYDIISAFDVNGDKVTMKGNFLDFVNKQVKINAPGKLLVDVNVWMNQVSDPSGIIFPDADGACLGDDYIYEHSEQIDPGDM